MIYKKLYLFLALTLLILPMHTILAEEQEADKISVKQEWISINGERFFVKAIGYSPSYPYEDPKERKLNKTRLASDIAAVKKAGFNTLRTWEPLLPIEVEVVKEAGLFLITGIDVSGIDLKDKEKALQEALDLIIHIDGRYKDKDAVLYYLLENIPYTDEAFYSDLKKKLKSKAPHIRVSVSGKTEWGAADLMPWDIKSVQLYPFYPATVRHALGYYSYVQWAKKMWSPKSPLIMTDLGFSLISGRKDNIDYCSSTVNIQKDRLIDHYEYAIDAGANGMCIMEWSDAWWRSSDSEEDHMEHEENDPVEWFGINEFYEKKKKLVSRPANEALTVFNKMLVIHPKNHSFHKEKIFVETYTTEEVDVVEYRIDDGEWKVLKRHSDHWLDDTAPVSELEDGKHVLYARAWKRIRKSRKSSKPNLKKTHKIVCEKTKIFFTDNKESLALPYQLSFAVTDEPCSATKKEGGHAIKATATLKDAKGKPVAGKDITYSLVNPVTGLAVTGNKTTDSKGETKIVFCDNAPGIYTVAAGAEKIGKECPRIKTGALETVIVKGDVPFLKPVKESSVKKAPAVPPVPVVMEPKKAGPHTISIKDHWIYVDDEKFFVKGIGYSPAYPKELPWKRGLDHPRMRKDFELIRKAGFNTLRTWIPLAPEEIDLAREHGLFVIQGVWVNYTGNFVSGQSLMSVISKFYQEVDKTKDKDNLLLYLLGNEPLPSQLFAVGLEKTDKFFMDLKNTIEEQMPETRVSMANWVQSDFLNTRIWDVVCINLYPYYPESVSHSLGYYGYTDWVKRAQSYDKPLILTEMGLSVSLGRRGSNGYGGNTTEAQSSGLISCFTQAVDAGVNGACIFEWMDEWWKNFDHGEDHMSHEENDPEEWFGIAYYDEEKKELITREAYDALSTFNRAIVIHPKGYSKYTEDFDAEIYVNEDVDVVDCRIDRGKWEVMERVSPHWMSKTVSLSKMKKGDHTFEMRAWKRVKKAEDKPLDETHEIICEKKKTFIVDKKKSVKKPYHLVLDAGEEVCYTKGEMTTVNVTCTVTDDQGNPVKKQEVKYSITEPLANQALRSKKTTDKEGKLQIVYFVNEPGIISFAAGTERVGDDVPLIKAGDVCHVSVFYNEMSKFRRLKCVTEVGKGTKKEEGKKTSEKSASKKEKADKKEEKLSEKKAAAAEEAAAAEAAAAEAEERTEIKIGE